MKKIIRIILFAIFFIIILSSNAYSENNENQAYNQALTYDFGEIEEITDKKADEYNIDINFNDVLKDKLNTEVKEDNNILKTIAGLFFGELKKQNKILKNVIIICVLSGIFKALTDGFKTKEISETGFYVCFIASVMLLINSFSQGLEILRETVIFLSDMSKAVSPVLAMIMISCSESTAGGIIAPFIAFMMNICLDFMTYIFIPGIKISAVISIVNYLGSKELLRKLSEFITWILALMLKLGSFIFISIISMQKIGAVSVDNVLSKTIQGGISAVPVVGDIFSGAAGSVLGWSRLLKTGFGISVVVICVILCTVPIIKILIFMLLYKITAIITEPFCDKRLTSCIDTLGNYMFMILSGLTAVLIMFVFSVVIVISSIGG